ncbi:DUF1311 domain-containing protein [Ruegeria sediminis]|uniref:DUF1311 domain-containing protein n=1 Tax=Ruegeria sediminis TaxID=2583820 RepID=A0ABY2WTZ6_9RHOB|nr:MliC family protein [Ruegeria sediminis]TMV05492.1 DUF1311 domain-containing protein [Ruegeria sediminis]
MVKRHSIPLVIAIATGVPTALLAEADGPDFFAVVNVAEDDVLNIRSEPDASSAKVGAIPPHASGIRNLGCEGGLSFAEWSEATQAERDAAARKRWCKIEYDGVTGWVAARFLGEGSAPSVQPAFNCSEASGEVEIAICADPWLARLDHELNRLYQLAVTGKHATNDRLRELKAVQRGWIKGRNDCWKSSGRMRDCISAQYVMRIDELRTGYADARSADGAGDSLGPFPYVCEGLDAALSVTVVNADPSSLSIRWRDQWVTPVQVPSGSGARYQAELDGGLFEFWMKGDGAMLSLPGQGDFDCRRDEIG